MQRFGLSTQDACIQHGDSISLRTNTAVDHLLAQKCTAIITSNSLMSVQASYHLSSLGLTVGKDMDLVAYKDYEFYNSFLSHCDVIVQPVMEFGDAIGSAILERIANPSSPLRERVLTSAFQPKAL